MPRQHSRGMCRIFLAMSHQQINYIKKSFAPESKTNLRDLIAATGLVILLKLDSNHRFFSREMPNLGQNPDIGKSTGPRSSNGENSRGPMKTLIVLVLLSGKKKIAVGSPSMGIIMLKKIRSCKNYGGPVKLRISMWLPVLQSSKGPKVFPMSENQRFF